MEPGTPIRYRSIGGSWGVIESENHYGGYYVRFNYGLDNFGRPITSLSSVRKNEVATIDPDLYKQYIACRAWTPEQKIITMKEMQCPHETRKISSLA